MRAGDVWGSTEREGESAGGEMSYLIHLAFDSGSGVCLWAKNEVTATKFGYAIDHWTLPLSRNTQVWLQHLISWYDTSLDWDDPGDPIGLWKPEEKSRFASALEKGHQLLLSELPAAMYEIVKRTPSEIGVG
jgi:hypothetical protein